MQKGLVSIITPCYNTGKYIHRLLDSILSQDYSPIAMLVVDDGSTDNSREVIESYIPRFAQRGYSLEYRYQENSGQSVAINNALKWVDGEFLVWPDSDDWFDSEFAISKMVSECKKSDKIGLVRCLYKRYNESLAYISQMQVSQELFNKDQFENCIFKFGGSFAAGACMARMEALDEAIPNREIFTERIAGQNGQLMLPLLHNRECVTIPEYLYAILGRTTSHSQGSKTFEQSAGVVYGYIHQVISTLEKINGISQEDLSDYKRRVKQLYLPDIFVIAVFHGKKQEATIVKNELKSLNSFSPSLQWRVRYYFCQYQWFRSLIRSLGDRFLR